MEETIFATWARTGEIIGHDPCADILLCENAFSSECSLSSLFLAVPLLAKLQVGTSWGSLQAYTED